MKPFYTLTFLFLGMSLIAQSNITNGSAQQILINSDFIDVSFSNQNSLLSQLNFSSRIIVGVADMNGDKLDDIIRLENAQVLTIEYQSQGGIYTHLDFGEVSDSVQWSLAIADVDANGFNDILLSGENDGVKLFKANNDGTNYEVSILTGPNFFAQGSNFSDIDSDGDSDIFVCNDLGNNHLWQNDGLGNFTIWDDYIDMSTVPISDNSGNYSSVWSDFDNDNDLDFYISKCKAGEDDPNDPRRINQLFVNDNNIFTEAAGLHGLKIGAQTWVSDFQDIDNDGDLDCLVINHYESSQLLENINGNFVDISDASGLEITANHLQGQMRDFDNDGFVDILVAGNNGYEYYENNGNKTFTKIENLFGNYHMGTFALGDLNHDGFLDIYSGSSSTTDVLWINSRNENHYFAVNLTGTSSNINGIGSRLEIYGNWGVQIREVRAGESYGIVNSFTQYFGLGAETIIDSLIVRWPSGLKEVFFSPNADQVLNIHENECAYPDCFIFSNNLTEFCSGDSLLLQAPAGSEYVWSNGAVTQNIHLTMGGIYEVTVSNAYGCTSVSNPITITQDPDDTPQIIIIGSTNICLGQTVTLFSTAANSYEWSTNATSQSIIVYQSGTYSVTAEGLCGFFDSEPVEINVIPVPDEPVGQNDTIMTIPGIATLTASGANLFWYDQPFDGNLVGTGNIFVTDSISETTCYFVEAVNEENGVECRSDRVKVFAVVDDPNGIFSLEEDERFIVFPNPANVVLSIKKQFTSNGPLTLQFSDLDGRLLKTHSILDGSNQVEISLSEFPAGIYFLSIFDGEKQCIKKLVVQR